MRLVVAAAQTAGMGSLSAGQAHDAPEGHKLLGRRGGQRAQRPLVLDWADAGNETRQLVPRLGFELVVPPLKTRGAPWEDDREMDERRNDVEHRFRHLRRYRRIFSRVEKLALIFLDFSVFALVMDAL